MAAAKKPARKDSSPQSSSKAAKKAPPKTSKKSPPNPKQSNAKQTSKPKSLKAKDFCKALTDASIGANEFITSISQFAGGYEAPVPPPNPTNVSYKWLNGATPLLAAVYAGRLDVVQLLLQLSSVQVNAKATNAEGFSALHIAAHKGDLEMLKFFFSLGSVDVNTVNKDGVTPLPSKSRRLCGVFDFPTRRCEQGRHSVHSRPRDSLTFGRTGWMCYPGQATCDQWRES